MARVLLVALAMLIALPAGGGRRVLQESLADGLRAAQGVVVARVLEVERDGTGAASAEFQVLATLKGDLHATQIRVASPPGMSERALGGEPWFSRGGRLIALVEPSDDGWALLPAWGRIELGDAEPTLSQTRAFVGGYLQAIDRSEEEPEAVKTYLTGQVEMPDPTLRALALSQLGPLLTQDDLPFLARIYSDPKQPEHSRRWAVTRTAVLEPHPIPSGLESLLAPSESSELRRAVVLAFGSRPEPAYLSLLVRGLQDPDPGVRSAAVEGLGFPEAVPALRNRFEDEPDPGLRRAIVRRLSTITGPEASSALQTILDESVVIEERR